jgi:hypothetical protein
MSGYFDHVGQSLSAGDYVHYSNRQGELFQIQALQFPSDAIIRNVIPGGRLGTDMVSCRDLTGAINNLPEVAPPWFETTYEDPDFSPARGTELPCGCHLRRVDMAPVLCQQHLIEANG